MKKWKSIHICLMVVFCIGLNIGGGALARLCELPLWMDTLGTILCTYLGGITCGALVGITSNLLFSALNPLSWAYGLISVVLAVIVGIGSRRGAFDNFAKVMGLATLTSLSVILISVPLNLMFNSGHVGNTWGQGVFELLREFGVPRVICSLVGQFYVDFVDKSVTLLFVYLLIHLNRRWFRKKRGTKVEGTVALLLLGVVLATGARSAAVAAEADETETASYHDYVQTVYNSSNGLPCGEANDIAQTQDGILWIGTYAGLYRYNGKTFRWMDNLEGVRNVNCLYVDQEGRLWIGTNDNGLAISINERIVNILDQSSGLNSNSVRSIVQGSDGRYYVGTTGSMVTLELHNGLRLTGSIREISYCDSLAADTFGHVAAVTQDGRMFLLSEGQILSSLRLIEGKEFFNTVGFDPQGRLLAGTSAGRICIYDISENMFKLTQILECSGLNSINDLLFLDNDQIFVTADNGVGYLDARHVFHPVNTNAFNNSIDHMILDYQGNFWFTSSRLGLLRLAESAFEDVYAMAGMDNRVVNAVTRWNGIMYFGTDNGLDAVDLTLRRSISNTLTERLEKNRIRCLLTDSGNHLWICTYGSGLMEVVSESEIYVYDSSMGVGDRVRLVRELDDGTLIVGTNTGISFIRNHEVFRSIGYAEGRISSMILTATERRDGSILVGTDGDGLAIIRDGEVTRMMTRRDGLSSEVILRTVADPGSDGIFIVTSNGLCYMDGEESIRPLKNFPYFNCYDIWVRDERTLFVMSSAGIYVVKRDELVEDLKDLRTELLDSRRGLNSALTANSWNYSDEQGRVYLPCDKGVFVLDSRNYRQEEKHYRISVPYLKMDKVDYIAERNMPIEINRGVSRVELYPEILNYTVQNPTVGYYLEGFENNWTLQQISDFSSVVYTNLPAGEYLLHLAVFDSNNENILEERSFQIYKKKKLYEEIIFQVYLIGVGAAFVAWMTWYLVNKNAQRRFAIQERELQLAKHELEMGNQTIIAIAKAVDAKDERTSQHSSRVSEYSVMIAREMGWDDHQCENLRKAAQMHDIGKIAIRDDILNKAGRLTDSEYEIMKSHAKRGAEILKDLTLIEHVVDGARYHHERYDGNGYPDGLRGEDIPIYGRIIGVADAFDAMTANRVYRNKMDLGYVIGELKRCSGTQFDPEIVKIFLKLLRDGTVDLEKLYPGFKMDKSQMEEATRL